MDLEKTIANLKKNEFEVSYFETGAEAAAYLDSRIDGKTVGFGDSETLRVMGISAMLAKHNTVYDPIGIHDDGEFMEIARKTQLTDIFLTSVNAISETGALVNIDGTGNRVAALCFGPRQVIVVAGMNKVCGDLPQAFQRARHIAAPANAQRFGGKTPCTATGLCGDCKSPDCICAQMVVTRFCKVPGRIKVVLVGEDLGL